ncbi:hypothetical protein EMCRGX_G009223 [Ephydatia muelleri]
MVNGTDLMRRTPLHMSAGDPNHLDSSWILIENGGQVTPCDVLGVRPLDLFPELERMQSKRIGSICEIFTATTLPNPHPASSSSSPSLNSHPNSQLIGNLVPPLVIGGIPLSSSNMDPLLLDLLADVDQVRIQARRMLYKSRRPHSHPPKRHCSFSNLEDLREDEEDKMAAQDRLLKYPSAFDLQSYHLSRVVADAGMARSKLSEFMDAIKRFSLVNRSGAEETESDGEQPTNPLSTTKRWLSDSNMLDEVGGEGNIGKSIYVPLAISSNARPTSSEAIFDSTRTDISAGEGGARERPDSVSSMATLTESSRRVGGSPDTEGVVGPSMMEVKDLNHLSVTLDGDNEEKDVLLHGAGEEGEGNKRLHLPVDDQSTSHLRDLRPKSQEETSAIFDSLIAQINEARDSISPQAPVPKEGKFPSGGVVKAQSAPPPFVDNPMVEVVRPSPPARSKRSKKYPSPLKIIHRFEGMPPPPATATLATLPQGAPERRRKHSLPTIGMLENSADSTSTQISTSSSSTSLDTSFLYRLSSASGGSHDDGSPTQIIHGDSNAVQQ